MRGLVDLKCACILLACVGCLSPLVALAQPDASSPTSSDSLSSQGTTVWLFEAAALGPETLVAINAGVNDGLGPDRDTHLIGEQALREHVRTRQPTPPPCLLGEGECASARALALDALGLGLVVRVKVRRAGDQYEAAYTLVDRRGPSGSDRLVRARSPRDLGVALVRTIYDATGIVELTSTPEGARVMINGAEIGRTPLTHRLPIGSHAYVVSASGFAPQQGDFEVARQAPARVAVTLSQAPGSLIIEGAPAGATLHVEGREPLPAERPLELPPGLYQVEVRAPGFASRQETLRVEPGTTTTHPITLARLNPLLRDIPQDAIVHNRYSLSLSYEHAFQRTTFRGARGRDEVLNRELEFRRFEGALSAEGEQRRFFDPNGLRLALAVTGKYFGVTALSFSYLSDTRAHAIEVENLVTRARGPAELVKVTQLHMRPLQLSARYIYQNLVPQLELGVGFNAQWIDLMMPELPVVTTVRQTEAFWTLGLSAQYFLTPRWFALVRYSFQDYFNAGVGTSHLLNLGVGIALPNIFGLDPEPPAQIKE